MDKCKTCGKKHAHGGERTMYEYCEDCYKKGLRWAIRAAHMNMPLTVGMKKEEDKVNPLELLYREVVENIEEKDTEKPWALAIKRVHERLKRKENKC